MIQTRDLDPKVDHVVSVPFLKKQKVQSHKMQQGTNQQTPSFIYAFLLPPNHTLFNSNSISSKIAWKCLVIQLMKFVCNLSTQYIQKQRSMFIMLFHKNALK